MLIEITAQVDIPRRLQELIGIDEAVRLEVGSQRIPALFEPGRSKEDKLSAVQYVRFVLPAAARADFRGGRAAAAIVIDHPNYAAAAKIDGPVRESLGADLGECE
jgi:hypothetical protein